MRCRLQNVLNSGGQLALRIFPGPRYVSTILQKNRSNSAILGFQHSNIAIHYGIPSRFTSEFSLTGSSAPGFQYWVKVYIDILLQYCLIRDENFIEGGLSNDSTGMGARGNISGKRIRGSMGRVG
jgi:hypothetical protein